MSSGVERNPAYARARVESPRYYFMGALFFRAALAENSRYEE